MQLVFVRHAKAEDGSAIINDTGRELTAKGRKKARAVAKGLLHLLGDAGPVAIWTSPAARARQTAEIIAEELGCRTVHENAAIYTGRLEELLQLWTEPAAAEVLLVIGHEPYLSIWTQQLTDATVPFKKCAAASLLLNAQDPAASTLQWFSAPKTLLKLGEYEA